VIDMNKRLLPSLAVALALGAAAPSAFADQGAIDPTDVTVTNRAENLVAGSQSSGGSIFGWAGNTGASAVFRPAGGAIGPVDELGRGGFGESLQFVLRPDGQGTALWSGSDGTKFADRGVDSLFGATRHAADGGRFPSAAMTPEGQLALVFKANEQNGEDFVALTYRSPGGETFGNVVPLSTAVDDPFIEPEIVIGADGTQVVAWKRETSATTSVLQARVKSPDQGTFGPLLTIDTAGQNQFRLQDVAVDGSGNALVMYTEGQALKVAARQAGGGFDTVPQTLTDDGYRGSLALDAQGNATAAWLTEGASDEVLFAATRQRGGSFTAGSEMARDEAIYDPDVRVAPDGAALVHWGQERGERRPGMVAIRPAGGSFGRSIEVAPQTQNFVATLEPSGNVAALWDVPRTGGDVVVQAGGVDNGTPPALGSVRIPRQAVLGDATTFSAEASDWSGIRSVEWVFENGTATGSTVEHAFGHSGRRSVELRVTDRAGNVTTERRDVLVFDPTQTVHVLPPGNNDNRPDEPDREPPRPTLSAPKKLKLRDLLKKGVRVSVAANELTSLDAQLRRSNVVLAEAESDGVRPKHTFTLKPSRKSVGKAKAMKLELRLRVIDQHGNKRVVKQKIAVRR
jgi:hypothetical protein